MEVNNCSSVKMYMYHTSQDVHLIVRCIMFKKKEEKTKQTERWKCTSRECQLKRNRCPIEEGCQLHTMHHNTTAQKSLKPHSRPTTKPQACNFQRCYAITGVLHFGWQERPAALRTKNNFPPAGTRRATTALWRGAWRWANGGRAAL